MTMRLVGVKGAGVAGLQVALSKYETFTYPLLALSGLTRIRSFHWVPSMTSICCPLNRGSEARYTVGAGTWAVIVKGADPEALSLSATVTFTVYWPGVA